MRERLTTDKTKIFARENPTLMSVTKAELRMLYNEIFDRLQEYEVAEETGQIIVPPCKVGDTVYVIAQNDIREHKIEKIEIGLSDIILFYHWRAGAYEMKFAKNIGKTVFLTRAEAEQALKGGEEE